MKNRQLIIPTITTMTSLEIVKLINTLRKEEGNNTELRHSDLLAKIELEFLEEIRERKISPSQYKQQMPTGGFKNVKQYELNKTQTIQILMSESKAVRRAVIKYIEHLEKENELLKKELALQEQARSESRLEYKPMTEALLEVRQSLGKDTQHFHYSNEANLIYLIVLGGTCKKVKEEYCLGNLDNLRDNLTPQQIAAVNDMQKLNTSLIEIGMRYEERKEKLKTVFNRKWSQVLIDEHIRLEA